MPVWKPHQYVEDLPSQLSLAMHDAVVATTDLPGVPEGTKGKITVANGFQWKRYWVRFDNGVELGHLDARHIAAR